MTAKWQWGTVNVYVSDLDIAREIKRAEIFKLDNITSTWHYFGAGSRKYTIKGLVIGAADRDQIESDAINNVTRTLTAPWGTLSSLFINGTPKFTAVQYTGATIDGTVYSVDTTPLYDCEFEVTS